MCLSCSWKAKSRQQEHSPHCKGVNLAAAQKQLWKTSRTATLSLFLLTSCKLPNMQRRWPCESQLAWQIWKKQTQSAESFWYCVKLLITEKQHVRVFSWYSSRDSPPCAVKPCSVLWLWRCRLVLLKSCLISRPWNGGCGKGWQQQIKGEW